MIKKVFIAMCLLPALCKAQIKIDADNNAALRKMQLA